MRACGACATTTAESGRFCPACGGELVERPELPADPLIGQTIDGFAIEAVLGAGSFGTVYRGRQLSLDRPVALKIPSPEIAADPVMARRFAREARSAARITHPGVVAIYAVGELADGRPYLVMQLIEGAPLDDILADGPVPPVRALRIARLIASALAETHAANVVHRDLKPANIMWRRDRHGDDRITIVDFGIAVSRPGNADATRLTSGGLIGTPHYMAPEQAQGEHVDARADLYALGCIVFELVTGAPPFDGTGVDVLLAHIGRAIPTPSEVNPAVPEIVDALITRLLAKKPDDRPKSADELIAMLDAALAQLPGAGSGPMSRPITTGDRPARPPRARRPTAQPTVRERPRPRRRARWLVGAALAMVAVTTTGLVMRGAERPRADDRPDGPAEPMPPGPSAGHRQVVTDDGEMAARATLEDPIVAGARVHTELEVWNALGAPLDKPHLVVTIEDPEGKATGLTAPARGAAGPFAFDHVFPRPGRYVLRVFPPEAPSVFTIELAVTDR